MGENGKVECPYCKGIVISPQGQKGEEVCSSCGLVVRRTPVSRQSFTKWSPEWHSNWHEDDSETLKEWLTILRTVSCQLSIPSFPYREEAARKIRKENHVLFRSQKFGKNKRATVAALLFQVLKQYDKNRSVQEICAQLGLDSKLVTKQTWNLNKTFSENQRKCTRIPRKVSTEYLFEFGGRITVDTALLVEAEEILIRLRRSGGNPIALASGALYHVFKSRKVGISKERIAETFRISHRTVYTNEVRIRKQLHRTNLEKNTMLSI